jgi:DNA-binding NarL/FixJ family response regulator
LAPGTWEHSPFCLLPSPFSAFFLSGMVRAALSHTTAEVINAFSTSSKSGAPSEKPRLSDREMDVVQLVSQGFHNKEIGKKLFISEQTVKNHMHNIFDKLGVSDRLELALYAIHQCLIEKPDRS